MHSPNPAASSPGEQFAVCFRNRMGWPIQGSAGLATRERRNPCCYERTGCALQHGPRAHKEYNGVRSICASVAADSEFHRRGSESGIRRSWLSRGRKSLTGENCPGYFGIKMFPPKGRTSKAASPRAPVSPSTGCSRPSSVSWNVPQCMAMLCRAPTS